MNHCECGLRLTDMARLESEYWNVVPARCHGCIAAIVGGALDDEIDRRETRAHYREIGKKAARTVRLKRLGIAK